MLLQIQEALTPILETYQVKLRIDAKDMFIYCDEKWMIEALENIIKNCIEQMSNSYVDITCIDHSSYLEVMIKDYGNGIDKEDLPHIFERFYRVDKSHSREIGGTGLGLAITRSTIIMHRGAIKVHSEEGEGTTFTVRVPLNFIA